MRIVHRPPGAHAFGSRSLWTGWLMLAALAFATWLMLPVGSSGAASDDGAVAGLKPTFVDVAGVRTRYYEAGTGEPMVLFHGDGFSGHASANIWSKNLAGLGKRFHVFAIDKLASGLTDNPRDDKDYNIQGEIEHAYQFIKTMRLDKVHVVGQSRGGGLAFFLAVAHPEIVKTLVLVDTLTAAPKGATTRQDAIGKCQKEAAWLEWKCRLQAVSYKPDVAFDDEYFEVGRRMGELPKARETVAKMKAGAGEPLRSQFNAWKRSVHRRVETELVLMMPTLIYWGRNDPSAILARGLELFDVIAEQNPKTRMIIVNKAGHFHFREYPDEFNDTIVNFVDFWERPQSQ